MDTVKLGKFFIAKYIKEHQENQAKQKIEEAINAKCDCDKFDEQNYGEKLKMNPAAKQPDKEYKVSDGSKVINYKDNDGGKFPSNDFKGPEKLAKKVS